MITLITGAPGAGKTNALVDLLSELAEGRPLFVDGIPDLKVPHVELGDPHKWHETVPDGAAIVIDEVQRVWRPNRGAVPDDIAALETHRHRGLDFFIVTQGPNLVHSNVRALVGRHVHLRDTGITGRWWYEWPECSSSLAWKSAPVRKKYNLSKKAQKLYTSASMHIKPIRSIPRQVFVLAAVLPIAGYLSWHIYGVIAPKLHPTTQVAQSKQHSTAKDSRDLSAEATRPTVSGDDEAVPSRRYVMGKLVEPAAPQLPSAPVTAVHDSRPRGCIASAQRCRCFDADGMLMDMEPQQCRDAIGVAGQVLPLDDVPTLRHVPDFSPAARYIAPVPMAEIRHQQGV